MRTPRFLPGSKTLCLGSRKSRLYQPGDYHCESDAADAAVTVQCHECMRELRPLKHPSSRWYYIIPAHKPGK